MKYLPKQICDRLKIKPQVYLNYAVAAIFFALVIAFAYNMNMNKIRVPLKSKIQYIISDATKPSNKLRTTCEEWSIDNDDRNVVFTPLKDDEFKLYLFSLTKVSGSIEDDIIRNGDLVSITSQCSGGYLEYAIDCGLKVTKTVTSWKICNNILCESNNNTEIDVNKPFYVTTVDQSTVNEKKYSLIILDDDTKKIPQLYLKEEQKANVNCPKDNGCSNTSSSSLVTQIWQSIVALLWVVFILNFFYNKYSFDAKTSAGMIITLIVLSIWAFNGAISTNMITLFAGVFVWIMFIINLYYNGKKGTNDIVMTITFFGMTYLLYNIISNMFLLGSRYLPDTILFTILALLTIALILPLYSVVLNDVVIDYLKRNTATKIEGEVKEGKKPDNKKHESTKSKTKRK